MSYPAPASAKLSFGGPFSPALASLRSQLNRETSTCWLLVALTCICLLPLSTMIFAAVVQVIPVLLSESIGQALLPDAAEPLTVLALFTSMAGAMFSWLGVLVPPILAIVGAAMINRRTYTLTTRDLVWGGVALCLVDESFSLLVEDAARERYRPNPNPVRLGNSFAARLNHFAYHYRQYLRLSHGPNELRIPLVIQGNCWAEGAGLAIGACLTCGCLGAILFVPLALRAILVWPRIIAIKQATIDFLAGKFDGDLEHQAATALPPLNPVPPA